MSVQTGTAILIKVNNTAALAKSQGQVAALAQSLLPATIEAKVYDTIATQLKSALGQQGVEADVTLVQPAAWKPANSSHIAADIGFAIGGAGLLAVIMWLVQRKR